MDMSHSMDEPVGLPWLNSPVMLHSSRADTCKLTPEQCAYRSGHWRYWYEADHVYALNTIYFLCATVGVFAIAHFAGRYAPARVRGSSLWQKGTAAGRFLAYKGVRVPGLGYWTASLGVAALILAGVIFFFAMTLGPRPYYWPTNASYGGSPPIATRAGWMAVALLPFVLALSAKANLISALTGVPHEKLQVFHHWTSYAMFVLALVHTFPFIVYNISIGGMMSKWDTSMFYWTGVATLLPQTWLTFMSLPSIRNRYYEFFKASHFIIALLFILFFFFHCNFRLSSWYPSLPQPSSNQTTNKKKRDYFIAAGSLYLLSLLSSLVRTHLINGRHTARVSLLPSGLLQIKIPTILNWTPGQHIFLRFSSPRTGIALQSLTSHPFTICSTSRNILESKKANEMVFYVKPKRGITGRLAKMASRSPDSTHAVLVEGPYGGIEPSVVDRSDVVVIISGGSGGGFSLPVFETALQQLRHKHVDLSGDGEKEVGSSTRTSMSTIKVVFATQSVGVARWYREEIENLRAIYGVESDEDSSKFGIDIDVSIHVTSPSSSSFSSSSDQDPATTTAADIENKTPAAPSQAIEPHSSSEALSHTAPNGKSSRNAFFKGRPDLPRVIATAAEFGAGKRVAVFVCGPASMLHDVRSRAADEQERILRGGSGGEVYLHSESFSW
ncbi:ferric reductase like transmembrane component-domain-containing protein [Aspergillus varians]